MRILLYVIIATLLPCSASAERSNRITGSVKDSAGNPIANATVLVHSAGVRNGYSVFCPTCYVDCGKRASTDTAGQYVIPGLSDDLVFNLLVVKQGYATRWIRHVDPAKGPAKTVTVKASAPVDDPGRVLRGKVVDARDHPVRDALIEVSGVTTRQSNGAVGMQFGGPSEILAVSNDSGEFDLAADTPALNMLVLISPRGMAPKKVTVNTGSDRKTITVTDGVAVRGRLIQRGTGVPNVEFGIRPVRLEETAAFPEERAATDAKGRFLITNVPPMRVWNLYATWVSLGDRGAVEPIQCATGADEEIVDVGDIQLKPGLRFSGRVLLSDGKAIPPGMTMLVTFDRAAHSENVAVSEDGRFELGGLVPGAYELWPAVRGYKTPEGTFLDVLLKRSVNDYVIRLEPAGQNDVN
jgi:uncharacterized GH25 family protein